MRLVAAAFSVIIPVVLGACHDSTGPEQPSFSISVTLESTTPPVFVDTDTVPQIECDIRLRAVAQGPGSAIWGAGTFYVYAGPDRSAPVDSTIIPSTVIRDSWGGASSIDAAHELHADWRLTAAIPFGIGFVYTYIKNGETKRTIPVVYTCGPTIPPGVAPPVLNAPAMSPASGEIENGDTLYVGFSATSVVGMWESDIDITGACALSVHLSEHLSITITHNVPIVIPPACALGQTLSVALRAYDAAGRGLGAQLGTLSLVDRTPPLVAAHVDLTYASPFGRYVFGGERVALAIGASDNHALSGLFWKIPATGVRDSILGSAPSLRVDPPQITVPDSVSGKYVLRVWSRDAVGLLSDTVVTPPDSIRVIPTRNHPVHTSPVLPGVGAIVVAESRGVVYVTIANPPEILGISLQSLAVTDTIPLPAPAGDIDVMSSGDSLVVTLPANRVIGIIDLTSVPRTVTTMALPSMPPSNFPVHLRSATNGNVFVTLGVDDGTQMLLELNLQTGTDRIRTDALANGFTGPAVLERSHDHSVVVVDGLINSAYRLQRWDSGTDSFGRIAMHMTPFQPALDGNGTHTAVGDTLYDAALSVDRECESPATFGVFPVALSNDGTAVFQAVYPFGLLRDSAATGELLEHTQLALSLPYLMRSTSDGKIVIVNDNQNSRVAVIELQ